MNNGECSHEKEESTRKNKLQSALLHRLRSGKKSLATAAAVEAAKPVQQPHSFLKGPSASCSADSVQNGLTREKEDKRMEVKASEVDNERLRQLARERLLRDTRRSAMRANDVGPQGWLQKPKSVNLRFLSRTLVSATLSNADAEEAVRGTQDKCRQAPYSRSQQSLASAKSNTGAQRNKRPGQHHGGWECGRKEK